MTNGFKKELMFFTRGGRLALVIIVVIVLALLYPVMFGVMKGMMSTVSEFYSDTSYSEVFEMFTSFTAADMTMYTVETVAGIGAIVILFVLKGSAGGEQQKRSVIIPQCSGLSPENYALPKFVIYPLFVFVICMAAVYGGAGVSCLMFPGNVDWSMISIAALCTGVYLAFSTALQLCLGICTGRSGAAIAIVIILQTFLPSILSMFRVDRFNPFALYSIALQAPLASADQKESLFAALSTGSVSDDVSALNIAVSIGTAVVISVILYFITIFVLHAKEVHNEGSEPLL